MLDSTTHHIPILLEPISNFLVEGIQRLSETAPSGVILDCTLGGGGHSASFLHKLYLKKGDNPEGLTQRVKHQLIGIDRDLEAISRNKERFKTEIADGKIDVVHASFSQALSAVGNRPIYGLLADLGISSDQIDSQTRGFSFRYPAPLDMRMNTQKGIPLSQVLQDISESELADVIWKYGEERFSRKIARKLIDLRGKKQLPENTLSLADAIASSFPPALRHKGTHPATRTFQALRIYVNQELEELETLIRDIFPKVATGGRLAILSFHSLEDRPVKEAFRNQELYDLPQRKAIQASDEELEANSRSRSAKLRLAIRK